jgi:hypothetical protein
MDRSLSGRKRELTTLRFMVNNSVRVHERTAMLRAAVPIVYSHWEGFVKFASVAYLTYVARQPGPLRQFTPNIIALALRTELAIAGQTKKTSAHATFFARYTEMLDSPIVFQPEEAITTAANLNSEVLREIMVTTGLPYDTYWQAKSLLIDHKLLKTRNEIVHGELVNVDARLYEELHVFVIDGLERFKTAIENAAALGQHRSIQ